jgi:UTP-glucose-1-phosphate uridylyltransferase
MAAMANRDMTLVVLAAGIGSRYGGLKQIEPVGPGGAIVIDYSVYDALRAGFTKVVCVIRRDIAHDFHAVISSRFERHIPVEYVFQELFDLPDGWTVPADRKKPWGTAHAVRACRGVVREPFAAINADDLYGRRSFEVLAGFLRKAPEHQYAMVGFTLRNTLSEHGSVARGICDVDAAGCLRGVVERTKIEKADHGARALLGDGQWQALTGDELVSMNMWGFTPSLFPHLEREFAAFLKRSANDAKAEFFMPTVVDTLIREGRASCRVLGTPEPWYGVTYPRDKPVVAAGVAKLVAAGVYPERLWDAG